MERIDRLTTLMTRFNLSVRSAPPEEATLAATVDEDGAPDMVLFRAAEPFGAAPPARVLFSASVDWGGPANPLMAALPATVACDVSRDAESAALIRLMGSELAARRCGAESVVSRLGEVLIVRMLRAQIEAGAAQPGLLAGLADPRLSRAIVAIHDRPGRAWRNEDLAREAGLSLSRFSETFLAAVGEPPAGYLRRWRLTLARQDMLAGDRVEAVARRYGFASPEGFARAFRKRFGANPVTLRPRAA